MKTIKTLNPIEGVLGTLRVMGGLDTVDRSDVFNIKIGEVTIDTVVGFDTGIWETGIKRGEWVIVEQYETRKLAEKGHKKWVNKIKKNPKIKLEDINIWSS